MAQQDPNPYTIHIIHIPLYYHTASYIPPTSSSRPTTTAPYIALTSASPASRAIISDCLAWGWRVSSRSTAVLAEDPWWESYQRRALGKDWDADLWRIWQREHGVRILQRELEKRGSGEVKGRAMAVLRLHRVGRWVWVRTGANAQREVALREVEDRCAELRREEAGRKKAAGVGVYSRSTLSLDGSVMGRLEAWRETRRASEGRARVGMAKEELLGNSALDNSALDNSALDNSALDNSALDNSALDNSALEDIFSDLSGLVI